jgi:hypothetical protein
MSYPIDQDRRKDVEGIAMREIVEMIEEGGEVIAVMVGAMVIEVVAVIAVGAMVIEVVEAMVIAVGAMVIVIEVAVEIVEGTEEVLVVMRIASDPVKMGVTMVSFPFEYYVL